MDKSHKYQLFSGVYTNISSDVPNGIIDIDNDISLKNKLYDPVYAKTIHNYRREQEVICFYHIV